MSNLKKTLSLILKHCMRAYGGK